MIDAMKAMGDLLGPGVYALLYRRRIVYIGQSVMLLTRIYQHRNNYLRNRRGKTVAGQAGKAILFDDIKIYPCAREDLDRIERSLIANYRPEYNTKLVPKTTEELTISIGGITLKLNETNPAIMAKPTNGLVRRI